MGRDDLVLAAALFGLGVLGLVNGGVAPAHTTEAGLGAVLAVGGAYLFATTPRRARARRCTKRR